MSHAHLRTAMASALGCALATAAPTCERELPVRSGDVATRDMQLHLTVEGDERSTRWLVWLLGPAAPVRLDEGDDLLVDGATMRPAGEGAYAVERPPAPDGGRLVLRRDGPAEDVLLDVALPPLPVIEAHDGAPRGEPLVVTWDAAEGPWSTTLRLEGPCLPPVERRLEADDGSETFLVEELEGEGGCDVTIRIDRLAARDLGARPLAATPSRLLRRGEATIRLLE